MRLAVIFTTLILTLLPTAARSDPGQFVEFDSGWGQSDRVRLMGYLARPSGPGPFPAVVILHSSGGFRSEELAWADRLSAWGYVALAVDSFGRRGIVKTSPWFLDQPADAFQALRYLEAQPFVRANDVGVMGFSLGGQSVLVALERDSITGKFPEKFRAGVAFYPPCGGASGIMTAPTLVLIGELDDWTRASACEDMVAGRDGTGNRRRPGDRSMVELVVYPGAHHAFDLSALRFSPGVDVMGHRLAYNDAATRDAIQRVRAFFKRTLNPD